MLWRYAARELLHHPARTALVIAGVSVATAMMVSMLMLGAGMRRSFAELLLARGYSVRVSPAGTLPLDTRATLPEAAELRRRLLERPEVDGVAPVLATNLLVVPEPRGEAPLLSSVPNRVFALGVDPQEQGVFLLREGRLPGAAREVVVGAQLAEAGVATGDSLSLERPGAFASGRRAERFRVVGVAEFLYASQEERPVALRLAELQALTEVPDRVSFLMLRLRPEGDADRAAAILRERFPGVEVASVGELVERAEARLSYFRQLALVLGAVSLVVAVLLVGTLMYVSINDRYGTIAALRAIGVSRRSVIAGLAGEGLTLCAIAGLLGLGLGVWVARYLDSVLSDFPGLPLAVRFFVLRPRDLVTGYVTLLAAGVLATLVPAWRAASYQIAPALHREEP